MRFLGAILAILGVYLAVVAVAWWFQDRLVYRPDKAEPQRAAAGLADMVPVRIATADGLSLLAWYKPAQPRQPTLLYLHGNTGSIGLRGPRVRPYLDRGIGVLLLEYRGFGGNAGSPSEKGLIEDASAAYRFLREEGVIAADIVPYGESLGSAVAAAIAAKQAVGAVVLEAPFTTLAEIGAYHYWYLPVAPLVRDRYDTLARLGSVQAPVLVLHGVRDRVVPAEMGRRVYDTARPPKTLFLAPEAGHSDLPRHGAVDEVLLFLRRHIVRA